MIGERWQATVTGGVEPDDVQRSVKIANGLLSESSAAGRKYQLGSCTITVSTIETTVLCVRGKDEGQVHNALARLGYSREDIQVTRIDSPGYVTTR